MADCLLSVVFAGAHASVQDAGRPGAMRYGVPASGPMDRQAFAAANLALGNAQDAAGVEISLGGLVLDCVAGEVSFALAGGGFILEHAGRRQGGWVADRLRAGDRLVIRPGPWGTWCYLAFAGRLDRPDWLGSRATHMLSGFGGGRLTAGQTLTIADATRRAEREGAIPCPVFARPRRHLHVTLGPQERFFAPETISRFLSSPWALTTAWDRMGVRLSGPAIAPADALDIPSEPVVRGSVQVAGDGVPTVLLADHQTTGGYPKIATVLDCELDAFVQLRPRDQVAFHPIRPAEAVLMARCSAAAVSRYRCGLLARR